MSTAGPPSVSMAEANATLTAPGPLFEMEEQDIRDRNICTNLMSLFFIDTRGQLRFGKSLVDPSAKTRSAILLSGPLFHATGCHSVMVENIGVGAKIVTMHHYDPERALEPIGRERVSTFGGVPAMVMQVLDFPRFTQYHTSSICSVSYGGSPVPPELARRIKEAWPVGQPSNGRGELWTKGPWCGAGSARATSPSSTRTTSSTSSTGPRT